MILERLDVEGAFLVRIDPHVDARGFFARLWCRQEFAAAGLDLSIEQVNISYNVRAGTLRGLHYSRPPAREGKIVRCQRGSVYDVIVDLRRESPTYLKHAAVTLEAKQHNAIWVPHGVAHGFQTLEDDTEVVYLMTEAYRPELADGIRYDDPSLDIHWPLSVSVIADRDASYPLL